MVSPKAEKNTPSRSQCKSCGHPIFKRGDDPWQHFGHTPRHPAIPSLGYKNTEDDLELGAISSLTGAIKNFLDMQVRIPLEWVDNYNELIKIKSVMVKREGKKWFADGAITGKSVVDVLKKS